MCDYGATYHDQKLNDLNDLVDKLNHVAESIAEEFPVERLYNISARIEEMAIELQQVESALRHPEEIKDDTDEFVDGWYQFAKGWCKK